jgi:hypothetical protein
MTFKLWFRPTLLVLCWMIVAAFTLSELSTVAPVLASVGQEQPGIQVVRARSLRARGPALSQRGFRP